MNFKKTLKMDPAVSRYLAMDELYNPNPQNVRFNMFQNTDFQAMPGVFGAALNNETYYVPYSNYYYKSEKSIAEPKIISAAQKNSIIPGTIPSDAQLPEQEQKSQVGFGDSDIKQDNEIDPNSLKKVPDNILKAFDNPTINVDSVLFKPQEKKHMSQIGKGNPNKLSKTMKKKLPKSKMKFL